MWRNVLISLLICFILLVIDEMFKGGGDAGTIQRNRMFKFTLYQDLLVALSILKMMVIEGYSISGVVERFRSSGPVGQMYIASSVVLHGALLFDEGTNHRLRLTPVPYLPPDLDKDQKDLFML